MFGLPGMGRIVTLADPGATLLDPVLSRLRRAARQPDTLAGLLCETLGAWGEKAPAAVPELRRLLQRGHPAVSPSPAAAYALGRIGPDARAAAGELRSHAWLGGAEAAWALWRTTGDASTAADALTSVVQPLGTGSYLPVHLAAMRHLAAITGTSGQAEGIARSVLANPRRLALSGGWRTFDEDDQIRAAAAAYLTSRA